MNGIVNVYKEKGYTSFDVVAIMRRLFKMKKIGHTGTLDPDATGVLPICLGKGTKVVELLTGQNKTYKATFQTGYTTDTQDVSGQVIEKFDKSVELEQVKAMLMSFVGEYEQVPPMYSALKQNGKKLYELARKGITVDRKARLVHIYNICNVEQMDKHTYSFEVTCSKGTYIRTLIFDLGKLLECGATMTDLERTDVGGFHKDSALTLDKLKEMEAKGELEKAVQSIDSLFYDYPAVRVDEQHNKALYNGNVLPIDLIKVENLDFSQRFRIYDFEEQFIGIYKPAEKKGEIVLKVDKMFY